MVVRVVVVVVKAVVVRVEVVVGVLEVVCIMVAVVVDVAAIDAAAPTSTRTCAEDDEREGGTPGEFPWVGMLNALVVGSLLFKGKVVSRSEDGKEAVVV